MASRAIGNVSPTLEEDAAARVLEWSRVPARRYGRHAFMDDIQAALQADKIMPVEPVLARDFRQNFGAFTRVVHQLFLRGGRMAEAAVNFQRDKLALRASGILLI